MNTIQDDNIFNNPNKYRKELLKIKDMVKEKEKYDGKSLICVFFTSYCCVGCPFCFFHSPNYKKNNNILDDIENKFNNDGVDKFIKFANDANVGYLQISGGGEPFLEKDAIVKCVEKINASRIILVTSGYWAYNKENAEKVLEELYEAFKKRNTETRLTVRVSISKEHSIKLKQYPLINLLNIFREKYKSEKNFTLQLKMFEEDNTMFNYLDKYYDKKYTFNLDGSDLSDDSSIIKIMPWRYNLEFEDGYKVRVGKSRIFYPNISPDLNSEEIQKSIEVFDMDLELSQKDFPSVVYNSNGKKGFDWIVEYNGNVCTWQNRVQDNLLNIYEDDYEKVFKETKSDLITLSFIEKGAKYREKIIKEISPKTVSLMKSVNIRDYAGTLLYQDEKIRLYYNIRVLQDYIKENRVNMKAIDRLPVELKKVILSNNDKLKEKYLQSTYSVVDQELNQEYNNTKFKDFLTLVKLGHFELSEEEISKAIEFYNEHNSDNKINSINDIEIEKTMMFERRITRRVMNIKRLEKIQNRNVNFYLCRHGETNWNVENKIKGQLETADTYFTDNGLLQIKDLIEYLKDKKIDAIFTSDLLRTKDTTSLINKELNIPVYYSKNLRGLNMGIYQGKNMSEFLSDESVKKCFTDYNIPIPGGESINHLNERFTNEIHNIINNYEYNNVAIISHGAAISNVKSYISKEKYEDVDKCHIISNNGELSIVSSDVYKKYDTNKDDSKKTAPRVRVRTNKNAQ